MFDKLKMIKQAKEMQSKMSELEITHEANGLKITANGKMEILSLAITNENLLQDQDKLERFIKQEVNAAIQKAQKESAMKMRSDFSGMF